MHTIVNLVSRQSIDFNLHINRRAFHHALVNEHIPIVYYCLSQFCPIVFNCQTIEFVESRHSHRYFLFDRFHLISLCCRLTTNEHSKRILLDAYAKNILRINVNDRQISMTNVLAYMQLWFNDEDIIDDDILFEHIMSLPYIDDIQTMYTKQCLHSCLGQFYSRLFEYRSHSNSIATLKQRCRRIIRQQVHSYCESRQINILKVLMDFNCYLPKTLQAYLCFSRIHTNSLINHLLNNQVWHTIQWLY
jgi:hypothetical protein